MNEEVSTKVHKIACEHEIEFVDGMSNSQITTRFLIYLSRDFRNPLWKFVQIMKNNPNQCLHLIRENPKPLVLTFVSGHQQNRR
jgi:hypothetical protein